MFLLHLIMLILLLKLIYRIIKFIYLDITYCPTSVIVTSNISQDNTTENDKIGKC